jgi:FkbM family methyltransferase
LSAAAEETSAVCRKISPPRTTPLQLDKVKKAKVAEPAGTLPEKDIFPVGNLKFYLPNHRTESYQGTLARTHRFHEFDVLCEIAPLLPEHAVILDIGANIGNHSLFFGAQEKVERVIAFEPIPETFEILQKNVQLNDLQSKIDGHNIALGEEDGQLAIAWYSPDCTDCTVLKREKDGTGTIPARKLDSLAGELGMDRIDFVKLDVEGFESFVFAGARETFEKFKPPYVQVEIYEVHPIKALRNQFPRGDAIRNALRDMGYELKKKFPDGRNYLYGRAEGPK